MLVSIQILLLLVQMFLAGLIGYLLLLTAVAWRASRQTAPRPDEPTTHFLILVPAHNEEQLLPETLRNLNQLDYPRALYAVHVVADNCIDRTAELARRGGAIVHERTNELQRGKGYALQWLLQRLWQADESHDAALILDADSIISSNFLRVMDARLARGERVIQSYYAVRDPDRSWSVSLRYVALAVLHYLRPLGRMVLGGSTGLKGNGMVFVADVLKRHEWSASITEDIEFHMALVLAGERVMFAPDAVVEAEMPQTLFGSDTQNTRWEQGRLQMARHYVPILLRRSWMALKGGEYGRAYLLFDTVMEHVIPPFSILAGLTGLCLVGALTLFGLMRNVSGIGNNLGIINLALALFNILGQLIYVFYGLHLVRAPKKIYTTLLYAPAFMIWKIWLYVRILLGRNKQGWVRTARNET